MFRLQGIMECKKGHETAVSSHAVHICLVQADCDGHADVRNTTL